MARTLLNYLAKNGPKSKTYEDRRIDIMERSHGFTSVALAASRALNIATGQETSAKRKWPRHIGRDAMTDLRFKVIPVEVGRIARWSRVEPGNQVGRQRI
jgi:hypothetical protein